MFSKLLSQLELKNSLLLTPNKRLATRLHNEFAQQQTQATWKTPQIFALSSWLEELWQQLLIQGDTKGKILLTSLQAQSLWQQIISKDSAENLLNIAATTFNAQQSYQLLKQWLIELDNPRLITTPEHQLFQQWARAYEQHCLNKQFLDPAELTHFISEAIKQQLINTPKHITLVSFADLRPDLAALINCLENNNCEITHWQFNEGLKQPCRLSFNNSDEELHAMANWAKQQWQAEPEAEIACVIPKLSEHRGKAKEIFYDIFQLDQQVSGDIPFNLSSGIAFAEEPIIYSALKALSLQQDCLSINDLSHLLRSPYLAENTEQLQSNALLAFELKNTRKENIDLAQLNKIAEKKSFSLPAYCKASSTKQASQKQSANQWARSFSTELHQLGWPGYRNLNSTEFQAVQRWLNLLDEFATLDLIEEQLTRSQALHLLNKLAQQTTFQTESINPKIHILGLLEAVGSPFHATWIMGLDDKSWPTAIKPNPFIPIEVQRELNMPHASAERELNFCQAMTEQLFNCSQQVICSHAEQIEGLPAFVSPLTRHLKEISATELVTLPQTKKALRFELEELDDSEAPEVNTKEKIRGGTGIIKQQAACPFRAFGEYRLKAKAAETPELGIDNKSKGILTHKVLELLWTQLKNQDNLKALDEQALNELIQEKIEQAFTENPSNESSAAILALEKTRLHKLIDKWLAYEKTRQPFSVIANEQWQSIRVGKLKLHVQVDRIDQVEGSNHFLIDYKTGQPQLSDWFGKRPNEPQLPLYATSHDYPVAGLAFAQLRPSEVRFKGVVQDKDELPNCQLLEKIKAAGTDNWQAQLKQWEYELAKLGNQFMEGHAVADPKNSRLTCQYCKLTSLCRIKG
jgi:probable DNA repair protein